MNTDNFSNLPLSAAILDTIKSLGYETMTPIQAMSLPEILNGKDILAQAKTGSGKTAAFGIGLLQKLVTKDYQTQALILCPTRELADQVSKELRRLARVIPNTKILTLCGGTPMQPQLTSLEHQPHIVVGTPGRILKHLKKTSLNLGRLKTLVLDEADRMLDMGFYDDIMSIINKTPHKRQTLLFSATYPDAISEISHAVQHNPVDIRVETRHESQHLKQVFYEVQKKQRTRALTNILNYYRPESCIIFCNRKQQCNELAEELHQKGFSVLALHGDLEQKQRDQVLVQFSNKSCSILIATDVAARGLDIKELEAVINYELSPDPEIHIHRIGRTGRAGHDGLAISLFTPSERFRLSAIEDYQKNPVTINPASELEEKENRPVLPAMITIRIHAGRKDKLRPGDILGALTANKQIGGQHIGKIDIFDKSAYVAVDRKIATQAVKILNAGKIKGRKFRASIPG